MSFNTKQVDVPGTFNYRLFYTDNDGNLISPFHDIPLWSVQDSVANMVVEIPLGTRAKMEISTKEPFNPVKQDEKKGKLRFVNWPYPCNYGAFPQTWENPMLMDERTQAKGDNDPIDVCEISGVQVPPGEVIQVKVLGVYAMIDEGETDWKVIAINVNDENINSLNDISDVETVYPGRLDEIFAFLKYYKTPTGSPPNEFGFDEKVQGRDFTVSVINETHEQWHKLITGEIPAQTDVYSISLQCGAYDSPSKVSQDEAVEIVSAAFKSYLSN